MVIKASSKLFKKLQDFFGGLTKTFFDELKQYALEFEDVETDDKGNVYMKGKFRKTGNSFLVRIHGSKGKESTVFDIVEAKDANQKSRKVFKSNIARDLLTKTMLELLYELFPEDAGETPEGGEVTREEFNASRRMKVSLKKVYSNGAISADIQAITANYNGYDAAEDVSTLLNDDTFMKNVGYFSPSTFEVVSDGEQLKVDKCNSPVDVDVPAMLQTLLCAVYDFQVLCDIVHWYAQGDSFDTLHKFAQVYSEEARAHLDDLAELSMEKLGYVDHPAILKCVDIKVPSSMVGFTQREGMSLLQTQIKKLLDVFNMYYCNFDHDVQSVFDNWIRDWSKAANYTLARFVL